MKNEHSRRNSIMARNYLLIIDPVPAEKELCSYFSQFNIDVVQESTLHQLHSYNEVPYAVLIDVAVLKEQPELIKQLYKKYSMPLLVTSRQRHDDFCIDMLESGADDILIKPIYPRELHARINAISRRVLREASQSEQVREVLSFTQWRIYPSSRQVFDHNDKELLLSIGEYELLLIFVQNPQKILDREFLSQLTKNNHLNPLDRRIDVQISRLRQKIERDAQKPTLIKTIRNSGYVFTAPVFKSKDKSSI